MITKFLEFEKYPEFKGVFVGGCVERGEGSSFRAKAHAHNWKGDKYRGWICVRSRKRLRMANGKPSMLMLHELAHILTPNHWHDDTWRRKVRELGGRLAKQYIKQIWVKGFPIKIEEENKMVETKETYQNKGVRELMEIVKGKGIKHFSRMSKEQLLIVIADPSKYDEIKRAIWTKLNLPIRGEKSDLKISSVDSAENKKSDLKMNSVDSVEDKRPERKKEATKTVKNMPKNDVSWHGDFPKIGCGFEGNCEDHIKRYKSVICFNPPFIFDNGECPVHDKLQKEYHINKKSIKEYNAKDKK